MSFLAAFARSPLGRIPIPIFGTTSFLAVWTSNNGRVLRPAAPWTFPLVVGALWFVWPAVDPEFKIQWGFMKDPNPPAPPAPEVKLDAAGKKAADSAFMAGHVDHAPSEKEIQVMKEIRKGEFGTLEKDWDAVLTKVSRSYEVSNIKSHPKQLTHTCSLFRLSSLVKMTTTMTRKKRRRTKRRWKKRRRRRSKLSLEV